MITQERRSEQRSLEQQFRELAELWRSETFVQSSVQAKIFNQSYQRIIGMGAPALSLIFEDLKKRGGHWYWALECITGENPARHATSIAQQKQLWLDYAVANSLL